VLLIIDEGRSIVKKKLLARAAWLVEASLVVMNRNP